MVDWKSEEKKNLLQIMSIFDNGRISDHSMEHDITKPRVELYVPQFVKSFTVTPYTLETMGAQIPWEEGPLDLKVGIRDEEEMAFLAVIWAGDGHKHLEQYFLNKGRPVAYKNTFMHGPVPTNRAPLPIEIVEAVRGLSTVRPNARNSIISCTTVLSSPGETYAPGQNYIETRI